MVDIPEQAVREAIEAYSKTRVISVEDADLIKDVLTAAAPHMSGVKVKQLEWVEIPACNGLNTANTQFGTYTIGSSLVVRYGAKSISKPLANLEEAKTVAQADYEKRVLSALEPSSETREHAFDAYMQIIEFFDRDTTAASFLREDGEGGFLSGIYRMAREVERLRKEPSSAREQALEETINVKGLDTLKQNSE